MTVRFACRCGKKMKTSDDRIGRKILCPACGSPVVVPTEDTVAVDVVNTAITSDTATDLLRGTATAGRQARNSLAFDDPTHEAEAGIDVIETIRYYSMTFLPALFGIFVVSGGLYWFISSAGRGSTYPDLSEVTGVISYDGEILTNARIIFEPLDAINEDDPKKTKSSAEDRTNDKGEYRLRYARDAYGAPIGECRVTISAQDEKGLEIAPKRFRLRNRSSVMREVLPGNNVFDFDLALDE